ncbi:MAG: hypothetical protein NZ739_05150 [Verrucomicrobiae bacterium]|nr:hypothetical protein [Verrucomicrobiae bacterium]MCX7721582.1 hypothetical protein [Verrucomicrobiae bacterium]MDW7979004.1 hypothetical protein [Verrucomicrobiales bacterium]
MTAEFNQLVHRVRDFIARAAARMRAAAYAVERDYAEFDEQFNALACELFGLQFVQNKVYRRFCEARGIGRNVISDWRRIPAMPTTAFKDFDVTCLPPAQWTAVFFSSGTTGQRPSRHFHSPASLSLYEASLLPWFVRHVLPESISALANAGSAIAAVTAHAGRWRLFILAPTRADAPCSSLVYMFDTVRREFGSAESEFFGRTTPDGGWRLEVKAVVAALRDAAESGRAVVLLGTAFAFVELLDYMAQTGFTCQLPPGSRVLETGGYKGRTRSVPKSELYGMISSRLGVPNTHIVSEYGMCELGSQAYDAVAGRHGGSGANAMRGPGDGNAVGRVFQFPPWVRVQVVSPETGEEVTEGATGLVRVFDLANAYSVLAVQTEDLAVRRGTGFELLGRARGADLRGCSLLQVP